MKPQISGGEGRVPREETEAASRISSASFRSRTSAFGCLISAGSWSLADGMAISSAIAEPRPRNEQYHGLKLALLALATATEGRTTGGAGGNSAEHRHPTKPRSPEARRPAEGPALADAVAVGSHQTRRRKNLRSGSGCAGVAGACGVAVDPHGRRGVAAAAGRLA